MIIPGQNHGKRLALEMMVDFCLKTATGKKAADSILQDAPGSSSCRKPIYFKSAVMLKQAKMKSNRKAPE